MDYLQEAALAAELGLEKASACEGLGKFTFAIAVWKVITKYQLFHRGGDFNGMVNDVLSYEATSDVIRVDDRGYWFDYLCTGYHSNTVFIHLFDYRPLGQTPSWGRPVGTDDMTRLVEALAPRVAVRCGANQ